MLYFLKKNNKTFNMHESHIHSFFWLKSHLSAITLQTFDQYQFLVQTFFFCVTPSYVDVV